jgi:hypothetical protein
VEDVRVQVDEAGRDELARRVDHAECRLGWNVPVHRRDPVALDGHVEDTAVAPTGVDDLAALDQEVKSQRCFMTPECPP